MDEICMPLEAEDDGYEVMRPKDIRAARRCSKGEIVEKSRKKELKKLAA